MRPTDALERDQAAENPDGSGEDQDPGGADTLAEAVFQAAVANAVEAIVLTGTDGRIRFANAAVFAVFGYSPEELVGRDIGLLMDAGEGAAHGAHIARYLAGGQARIIGIGRGLRARRKDGTPVDIHLSITEVKAVGEHLFVGVMRDVTVERETARRLEEARAAAEVANRAKAQFLANMSHELRTPLNAIIGFAEMIEGEMVGPLGTDAYRDYAGLIHEAGDRLLAAMNDILDMAQIETGGLQPVREPADLGELVGACVRLVQDKAAGASLTLDLRLEGPLPHVSLDRRLMRQALLKLLSNAIKFTPAGGRVSVSAQCGDGHVHIEVSDTGIGIAPDQIEAVQKPFAQADAALGRRFEGVGLGLPLARSLVELHGGRLMLESSPGVGTRAVVSLPLAAE